MSVGVKHVAKSAEEGRLLIQAESDDAPTVIEEGLKRPVNEFQDVEDGGKAREGTLRPFEGEVVELGGRAPLRHKDERTVIGTGLGLDAGAHECALATRWHLLELACPPGRRLERARHPAKRQKAAHRRALDSHQTTMSLFGGNEHGPALHSQEPSEVLGFAAAAGWVYTGEAHLSPSRELEREPGIGGEALREEHRKGDFTP